MDGLPGADLPIADALELLYQTANDLWTIRVGISYFNRANPSHHNLNSLLTVGILWPFLILLEDEHSDTQLHRWLSLFMTFWSHLKSKPSNHFTCVEKELKTSKVRYENAIADNKQVYNSVRIGGTGVEGQMVAWKVPVLCCTVSACHRGYSMVDM